MKSSPHEYMFTRKGHVKTNRCAKTRVHIVSFIGTFVEGVISLDLTNICVPPFSKPLFVIFPIPAFIYNLKILGSPFKGFKALTLLLGPR
jgi:hypothetical protein